MPSVLAQCEIDKEGVSYSGVTYIGLRSSKHNNSSAFTHQAPFSYLTLFCPIVNEISGPKRVTHHIFYSVQKIAVVQRKKES